MMKRIEAIRFTSQQLEKMRTDKSGKGYCSCFPAGSNNDDGSVIATVIGFDTKEPKECHCVITFFFCQSNSIPECIPADCKDDCICILFIDGSDVPTCYFHQEEVERQIPKSVEIGDDITFRFDGKTDSNKHSEEFDVRLIQAFGRGTANLLSNLSIGVVGASGTGSIVAEQLYRLGVGRLVLADADRIEEKNLGRILNSGVSDVGKFKVDMLAKAYSDYGLTTAIEAFPKSTMDKDTVRRLSQCDVIFGCVDSQSGKIVLNKICSYYLVPYFDVGVKLAADGIGGVTFAICSVNYFQPGRSSVQTRGMVSSEVLQSESLLFTNPEEYEKQKKEKYITGIEEGSPAVISINCLAASLAVNEFLARIHPYRNTDNKKAFCQLRYNLMEPSLEFADESSYGSDSYLERRTGLSDCNPLLGMPFFSQNDGT